MNQVKSKSFLDFFPVPKSLVIPDVGVSVLGNDIYFIHLEKGKHRDLVLKSYDHKKIPVGVIEKGEIKKPEKLVEILSELKKQYNLSFIKAPLPEEKAFLFRTSIPKMSIDEVREALQYKIEENVPLPADSAIFDFQIINENKGNGEEEMQIVVSVIPREITDSYLEVFKKSGLKPVLFEAESQSVARAVVNRNDTGSYLIVNASKGRVGLYIVDKGFVQFTSNLYLGEDFFTNLTFKNQDRKNVIYEDEDKTRIYTKTSNNEGILKDEAEKLLDYWNISNHNSKPKIKKIIVCGELALDKNLENYFHTNFSVEVEPVNVWTNTFSLEKYIPDLKYEDSFKYATAIGVAQTSYFYSK